jgi:hypothetical protein
MSHPYVQQNAAARQRLFAQTAHLSDADLNRRLENGWTVANLLAHLAFWDQYCLASLNAWERTGVGASPGNVHAINEAVRCLGLAIPPQVIVQLARDAADAVDRKLEEIPPEFAAAIESGGHVRMLHRALHRNEHLDQMERGLAVPTGRR